MKFFFQNLQRIAYKTEQDCSYQAEALNVPTAF